jgi:tetratricopeptide (TPR) repeat protein
LWVPGVNILRARSVNDPVESKGAPTRRKGQRATKEKTETLASAESAMRRGDAPAALAILDRVLAERDDHLGALELRARCEWQMGAHEPLVATLRRLIAINPYEPGYHALLGSALQCLGRYGEAARSLERATGTPGQEEALSDLRAWQAGLIAELIQSDPVFRAHYRQNPHAACASRGFHVAAEASQPLMVGRTERAALYTRPS